MVDLATDLAGGGPGGGGGGTLEFIGNFEVTGAAVQQLDLTGLAGDTADALIFQYLLINPTGAGLSYAWWPLLADPTTAARTVVTAAPPSPVSAFDVADQLSINSANIARVQGRCEVLCRSGKARVFIFDHATYPDAAVIGAGQLALIHGVGVWTDTASPLNDCAVVSSVAGGIGTGSAVQAWRRVR